MDACQGVAWLAMLACFCISQAPARADTPTKTDDSTALFINKGNYL